MVGTYINNIFINNCSSSREMFCIFVKIKNMYTTQLRLQHDEIPATINIETGEIKQLKKRPNNLPDGKQPWGIEEKGWRKSYDYSWDYLEEVLTDLELRVTLKLARMAKLNTNSLEPLSDETTQQEVSAMFNIDRRKAKILFDKLHSLGVFGKFDVVREDSPYTKYWILNPYLSFGGKLIQSDIANLFKGTRLTNEYYRRLEKNTKNLSYIR